MALPERFSLLHSELNGFLFATIGAEENGAPLSVLSGLTRLGIDPWAEGARLARLPREAAARALAPLIVRVAKNRSESEVRDVARHWPGCCRARGPPSRLGVPAFTRAGRRSRSSALALRSSSRSWLRADRCPGREKSAPCNLHHCKNAHESPHAIGEQRSRTPRDDPADNELAHDLSRTRNRRYPDGAAPRSGV